MQCVCDIPSPSQPNSSSERSTTPYLGVVLGLLPMPVILVGCSRTPILVWREESVGDRSSGRGGRRCTRRVTPSLCWNNGSLDVAFYAPPPWVSHLEMDNSCTNLTTTLLMVCIFITKSIPILDATNNHQTKTNNQ